MDTVLAAALGGLALVLAAVVPLLVSIARDARAARRSSSATHDEVKNDHEKNLRVDVDDKHEQLRQLVSDKHDETMQLLRAQGRRLGRVERNALELRDWLGDVDERTQPRPPTRRRTK